VAASVDLAVIETKSSTLCVSIFDGLQKIGVRLKDQVNTGVFYT
jgi:hypothetical protein